jgi:hypothetical protein
MLAHYPFGQVTPFRQLYQAVGSLHDLFLHPGNIARNHDYPLALRVVCISTFHNNSSALMHRGPGNEGVVFLWEFGVVFKIDITSADRKYLELDPDLVLFERSWLGDI